MNNKVCCIFERKIETFNQEIDMELEVTGGRAIRVWWAYLWRNILAVIVAMFVGGLLGGVLGLIMGALGASERMIQVVGAPIGFVIGMVISIVPIKMILGKDFGEFRLVLLAKEEAYTEQHRIPGELKSSDVMGT